MKMFVQGLHCVKCGRWYPLGTLFSCEDCGGCLSVDYDYEKLASAVNKENVGKGRHLIERYKWFLPIEEPEKAVSLDEGNTPFITCKRLESFLGLKKLYVKDETRNPTGTFKDRAITVGITYAVQRGYKKVVTASTGNAAAALSAYAARSGVDCLVLVPGEASVSKLFQILSYGATVVPVKGTVDAALTLLREAHRELGWYPIPTSTPFNPYQVEGNKTIAYEICQQNNWVSPDWVILPVGGGDCISANWKGFQEFHRFGFINSLPSMIGVQATGCNPLVRAFREKSEEIESFKSPKTIAHSILVGSPPTGLPALRAIRQSGGIALDVTEEEMLSAQRLLGSNEGIFAEPASAATIAALNKLVENGKMDKSDHVVCVITGTGLKEPEVFPLLYEKPKIIEPTLEDLKRTLGGQKGI